MYAPPIHRPVERQLIRYAGYCGTRPTYHPEAYITPRLPGVWVQWEQHMTQHRHTGWGIGWLPDVFDEHASIRRPVAIRNLDALLSEWGIQ
jgi:hypothetical protein